MESERKKQRRRNSGPGPQHLARPNAQTQYPQTLKTTCAKQKEAKLGDKGKKDKGKRDVQKKGKPTLKEKRKQKSDKTIALGIDDK